MPETPNDSPRRGPGHTLSPAFLALLRCPNCSERPELLLSDDGTQLICTAAGHTFPIDPVHGFPDLRPGTTPAPAHIPEK